MRRVYTTVTTLNFVSKLLSMNARMAISHLSKKLLRSSLFEENQPSQVHQMS